MPDAKERAMEYNLASFSFLCRKLDVHPLALAEMIIEFDPDISRSITSMDEHTECAETLRSFIRNDAHYSVKD
jgi:hypothetical protein